MLSRADSYLDDALKLDCDTRGDGSWGLSGPASTSPNVMDDALLNTTLSVVDFGTANDLEASTPISCGLGMAFVKDPSRPNQNKVSNTACAITCPPPLYPRRWTFTGPYLQWRGLISWFLWHITFFLLICFTFYDHFLMMSPRRSSVAAMDSTASTDFSSMDSATTAASTTMHSAA